MFPTAARLYAARLDPVATRIGARDLAASDRCQGLAAHKIDFATGTVFRTVSTVGDEIEVRIDKWLWASRVFKTRALATEACRAGHVKLAGQAVKPARPVHIGEVFVVHTASLTRTVRVVGLSEKRVGAKAVPSLLEDLTPPEEFERVRRTAVEQVLARPRGSGRPTKRDRRRIEAWLPETDSS